MNSKIYGFALVAILVLGLAASGAFASMSMSQGSFRSFDSRDLMGAIVKTPQDDFLGLVTHLW